MLRSVCSDQPAAGLMAGAGEINNMDAALHCWELAPKSLDVSVCLSQREGSVLCAVSITSHSHDVTLNLSSMVLRVVEVLMLQVPASSVMSIWGVDTVAAFLSRKLTSRAWNQKIILTNYRHQRNVVTLRNSSYWSAEVLV